MRSLRSAFVLSTALVLVATSALAKSERAHYDHTFDVRPGMSVLVDVSFHEVEVVARPGQKVTASVDLEVSAAGAKAQRLLEELEPEFARKGDTLVIRSLRRSHHFFDWSSAKGRVVVYMPPGIGLTVDTSSGGCVLRGDFGDAKVVCDTSSGSVRVSGAMRTLVADTSSGSVRVEVVRPLESFLADTSSGSVSFTGGARKFSADTSSGSVDADGLLGGAVFDTSSGSVTASWVEIPAGAKIVADTSSGGVRLTLPEGTVLRGEVDTSSGGIRSDFNGAFNRDRDHLTLEGGENAVRIMVDTSSGGVSLLAG